jgi:hypothetical protein
VFGDVGDPQLVGQVTGEGTLDQVRGEGAGQDTFPSPSSGESLQAGAAHQQLDLTMSHRDAFAEGELGVGPDERRRSRTSPCGPG